MPIQPSPMFTFTGFASGEDGFIDEGDDVVATLDSLDGVSVVTWNIESVDDQNLIADFSIVTSGPFGSVATISGLVKGDTGVLRCVVNNGVDPRTESVSTAMYRSQVFYCKTDAGLRTRAYAEDLFLTNRETVAFNDMTRSVDAALGGGKIAKMRQGFRIIAESTTFTPTIASDAPDTMHVAFAGGEACNIPDADTFLEVGDEMGEVIGRSFTVVNMTGSEIYFNIAASNTVYSGEEAIANPAQARLENVMGRTIVFTAIGSNTWIASEGLVEV